jgi:hypothetical protein
MRDPSLRVTSSVSILLLSRGRVHHSNELFISNLSTNFREWRHYEVNMSHLPGPECLPRERPKYGVGIINVLCIPGYETSMLYIK